LQVGRLDTNATMNALRVRWSQLYILPVCATARGCCSESRGSSYTDSSAGEEPPASL
jgi:hypothetical protein